MNLGFVYWTIVTVFGLFVVFTGFLTSKLTRRVARDDTDDGFVRRDNTEA